METTKAGEDTEQLSSPAFYSLKTMDAAYELMQKIKHHLNIELNEVNKTALRKFISEYKKEVQVEVVANEASRRNVITPVVVPRHEKMITGVSALKHTHPRLYSMVMSSAVQRNLRSSDLMQVDEEKELESFNQYFGLIDRIGKAVAEVHGITVEELKVSSSDSAYKKGGRRKSEYMTARVDFARLMFNKYRFSVTQIQEYLGYTNHTSVLHLIHGMKVKRDQFGVASRMHKTREHSQLQYLQTLNFEL